MNKPLCGVPLGARSLWYLFLFNHKKHEGHEKDYTFRVIRVFRGLKVTRVACSRIVTLLLRWIYGSFCIPFSLRHHRLKHLNAYQE